MGRRLRGGSAGTRYPDDSRGIAKSWSRVQGFGREFGREFCAAKSFVLQCFSIPVESLGVLVESSVVVMGCFSSLMSIVNIESLGC